MKRLPTTFELAQLAAQAASPNTKPTDAVRRAWELWDEAQREIEEHDSRAEYLQSLFRAPHGKDIPIFSDTPKEWKARLSSYPGEERDVVRAMWGHEFTKEEVQKQLFRDKKMTREQRHNLFLGLAKASIHYDMEGPWRATNVQLSYLGRIDGNFVDPRDGFPIHPQNLEIAEEHQRKINRGLGKMLIPAEEVFYVEEVAKLLTNPKLKAVHVRWAVEVRQRQLAAARARVIPSSLKGHRNSGDQDGGIQVKRTRRA